jgi:hypothetical protein
VISGNSAGLINIGKTSYVTACKNYAFLNAPQVHDDVEDLCTDKGVRIGKDCQPKQDPKYMVKTCPPNTLRVGKLRQKIKYDTLGVIDLIYFPHFSIRDNEFLEYVEKECGIDISRRCMRLTDHMMAYTYNDQTSYIFGDPQIQEALNGDQFAEIRTNQQLQPSQVLNIIVQWWGDPNRNSSIQSGQEELLAYLYSCSSIPESKQKSILTDYNPGSYGGGRYSNMYGTIIGLAIVVTLAFMDR